MSTSHTPATRRALVEAQTRLDRATARLRNEGTHDRLTIALAAGLPRPAVRCSECRLGLGVHTPTDPYCDHHEEKA